MKRIIERICLAYACLASLASLLWLADLLIIQSPDLPGATVAMWITGIHCLFLCITFQVIPSVKPYWDPVWAVTKRRLMLARYVIRFWSAACIGTFAVAFVAAKQHAEQTTTLFLALLLASMIAFSSFYMVVHWAFRPENIFSRKFLLFIKNPVLYWFR